MVAIAKHRLSRLLSPKSIAFVGGNIAAMAIKRCVDFGYQGEIWPVHPSKKEVGGYPCFASLDELPGVPDATHIGVRRELTIEAVRLLSEAGAGGCVCYAAGFAEMGEEGQELQRQLTQAAGDMPLIGPNCFGFINYADRCALWPYLFGGVPNDRGVALISQSGNIAMNLTMNDRSVRLTHVICGGNQAVLGPADYVEALLEDDRVTAIGMYIEGFDNVEQFAQAALRAMQKGIPIVVLKVGKTEASAKQSSSHTSSLTGTDVLYDAFFERLGVIRVDSLNRLLETLKILDLAGPLGGHNIFTLSCSGGEAATVADLAPRFELKLDPFSESQTKDLEAQFPNYVTVSNPFDYNTSIWGHPEALERCFTSSMGGDHDAAFLIYDHPSIEADEVDEWLEVLDAFAAAHEISGMPAFVICTISELLPAKVRERILIHGVIPLQGLEDGLYAYSAAARYHRHQRAGSDSILLPRAAVIQSNSKITVLDEWQSKQRLLEYGVRSPAGVITTEENAPADAESLGYPVVIKAVGEAFLHKSDMGAVEINLQDAEEVAEAARDISASCRKNGVMASQFLVEKMVDGAIAELIVGVKRDEQFGPALVIGSGGILVELMADSVSLLLPVDRDKVEKAIGSLSVAKLIGGYRGKPAGDMQAAVAAVLGIAAYAEKNWDSLLELDVNPLMVLGEGKGAVAADALILLSCDD